MGVKYPFETECNTKWVIFLTSLAKVTSSNSDFTCLLLSRSISHWEESKCLGQSFLIYYYYFLACCWTFKTQSLKLTVSNAYLSNAFKKKKKSSDLLIVVYFARDTNASTSSPYGMQKNECNNKYQIIENGGYWGMSDHMVNICAIRATSRILEWIF